MTRSSASASATSQGLGLGLGRRGQSTGTVANTQHGPMQVQLVLTGERITKVNVLQRTDDGQESIQIDSFAIPKLTSETLTAQSARIDAVSGATYHQPGLYPVAAERARPGHGVTPGRPTSQARHPPG